MTTSPSSKCPCGSGKKYKKCCGSNPLLSEEENIENKYTQIRLAENSCFKTVYSYFEKYDQDIEENADIIFHKDINDFGIDCDGLYDGVEQLFLFWLLGEFYLPPSENATDEELELFSDYLVNQKATHIRLRNDDKLLIEANKKASFSWYMVESVRPGISVELRDLFDDSIITVREHFATESLDRGSIILARVAVLFGIHFFAGVFPIPLTSRYLSNLLDSKDKILDMFREGNESLSLLPKSYEISFAKKTFFIAVLADALHEYHNPIMTNTDGDVMEFHELRFKLLIDVEAVLEKLKSVIDIYDREVADELIKQWRQLSKQQQKAQGLDFDFVKLSEKESSDDLIVEASVNIRVGELTLETNSEKRAKTVKKRLVKVLKKEAKLISIEAIAEPSMDTSRNLIDENLLLEKPEILKELERRRQKKNRSMVRYKNTNVK